MNSFQETRPNPQPYGRLPRGRLSSTYTLQVSNIVTNPTFSYETRYGIDSQVKNEEANTVMCVSLDMYITADLPRVILTKSTPTSAPKNIFTST